MVPSRIHLATLVDDMRRLGAQTAVVEHRGLRSFPTSYSALAGGAAWFAAELARREIEPGERVVLWGQNSAAWIACFFGCVLRGVLAVPLDATGTPAFAERIIGETAPRLVVGDLLLLQGLQPLKEQMDLALLERAIRDGLATPGAENAPELGPDTPLQILFTSGTTGEPKGIVHTHRNLLASLAPIEREIAKYRRYERLVHPLHFLVTLPLSHVFGQFMGLWIAPVLGAVVHYESRLEAGRLLSLLRRERISVLAAVPRVLQLLRAELVATHPELPAQIEAARQARLAKRWWLFRRVHGQLGFRFWAIVCGGATLPEPLESFWTTLGVALIQGYGMTETSALVTLNHPFKPARGTLGAALPGRELRIAADGELLVRGEMVATMRWQNGALGPLGSDGWLATGDLTRRDEAGRLHFLGRTGQRLVTAAGLNVYLEDVEAVLAAQPGVDAAVVLGVDDARGSEVGAVVRAAEAGIAGRAVEMANASLAAHQRIARWWLWPGLDLPRSATGKVLRHLVEAWARLQQEASVHAPAGTAAGAASATEQTPRGNAPDPLLLLIANVTGEPARAAEHLPPDQREQLSLESLGVDSLGRVQLQAAIERASGRSLDDAGMTAARTLSDVRHLAGLPSVPELAPAEDRRPANGAAPLLPDAARTAVREPAFLYLRWPWAAPARLLRSIFLEALVRPLVWLLAGPRIEYSAGVAPGMLCDGQPLLIVANHVSTYDVPLLLYALPSPLRRRVTVAAAGEMLEDWRHARGNPLGPAVFWLLTALFNVFPLPRSHSFRPAFLHAGEALDRDLSVLVFPEGARSHGGPLQSFQGGIGLLAQGASVAILPVSLEQAPTRGKHGSRPYRATIRIGRLLTFKAGEEPRNITTQIEASVRELLAHGSQPQERTL